MTVGSCKNRPGGALPLPRSSGILLHITSLPGSYGVGDLGPEAYCFADFLAETGQRIWQVLPLGPAGLGNSPYSSASTFAMDPLFVSPDLMAEDGLLADGYLLHFSEEITPLHTSSADFETARRLKTLFLRSAFERFEAGETPIDPAAFDAFCKTNAHWIDDYALFMALREWHSEVEWTKWPGKYALRDPEALEELCNKRSARIRQHKFTQFVVYGQWNRLKRYCNDRDILLFGDIPIYVAHDSADVWANPDLFHLDETGQSAFSGGVPPDYFSKTGQHWNNPTYRWDAMREDDFAWWTRRLEAILNQVDLVRLDHFRGFAAYWEIPPGEETAVNGQWMDGPGTRFFECVEERLGPLPLVAEDLGFITDDVRDLIDALGRPGMAVLQFAFSHGPDNPSLPHNNLRNLVLYTGTHDNDTFLGWWKKLASDPQKKSECNFARAYLGLDDCPEREVHWTALRTTLASPAEYVVFPMQDLLGLGTEARMNTPGVPEGNWGWRFTQDQLTQDIRERLKNLTILSGRAENTSTS